MKCECGKRIWRKNYQLVVKGEDAEEIVWLCKGCFAKYTIIVNYIEQFGEEALMKLLKEE
jgi:hypothetical protein